MNKTDSIAELAKALAKAQGEIENASKTGGKPAQLQNAYRPCRSAEHRPACRVSSHGLSVLQMPSFDGGIASV